MFRRRTKSTFEHRVQRRFNPAVAGNVAVRSPAVERSRGRLITLAALMIVGFGAATVKLGEQSMHGVVPRLVAEADDTKPASIQDAKPRPGLQGRPDILDRNGELLGRDIVGYDISLNPKSLDDPQYAAETIGFMLDDVNAAALTKKFQRGSHFEYIKRRATPLDAEKVHSLGLPGIRYEKTLTRAYPKAELFSHVLGFVGTDHNGLEGLEYVLDQRDESFRANRAGQLQPVQLSLDARVQYAVRDELLRGVDYYGAKAGVAIVLDVNNGELLSLVSVPDFDPNEPDTKGREARRHRALVSTHAMGSVMKPFTFALGLDRGDFTLGDDFDASEPLRIGRRTISDFHPQNRVLNTVEVFTYSSNIGTSRMVLMSGPKAQREFFRRLGFLSRVPIELPSVAPQLQPRWNKIEAATISYGHGISVTPLHVAVSSAALVNGGYYIEPTIFKRGDGQIPPKRRVIKAETSQKIRFLMRANVLDGSGGSADIEGLRVGGKTGTANKWENGKVSRDRRISSFVSITPADEPRFLTLVMLDEPTQVPGNPYQGATGGATAAPITGRIISRIAPMMDVWPKETVTDTTHDISLKGHN